jgi:hypothetical protein
MIAKELVIAGIQLAALDEHYLFDTAEYVYNCIHETLKALHLQNHSGIAT